jgi:hypothetical protein
MADVTEEQILELDNLSTYPHPFYAITSAPAEVAGEYLDDVDLEVDSPDSADAAVWSSLIAHGPDGMHSVMLDIDHRAAVIPTSTPGHHHLYIDVAVPWDKYLRLMEVMADCGLVEPGYVEASRQRGASYLRLPWISKEMTS